jgi:hypothetical protein
VFFQESLIIDRPAEEIAEILHAGPSWLRPLASWAWSEQDAVVIPVGPGDPLLRRSVRVEVGESRRRDDGSTAVPVRWHALSHSRWFPTLDGDLVVSPAGPDAARISFLGRYMPPMGALGRAVDDAFLHGLARDTILAFLRRIAEALGTASVEA